MSIQSGHPELTEIPGGAFLMGDLWGDGEPDEQPVRERSVTQFLLSRHTVTNSQYLRFLNEASRAGTIGETWIDAARPHSCIIRPGARFTCMEGYEDHPVTSVSWEGAAVYCQWLSELTNRHIRLPDEVEWQYAAIGPKRHKWSHGDVFEADRYISARDCPGPASAGTATPWGLYNITGNVFEWCADEYRFSLSPERGEGDALPWNRVIKGGSFILSDSSNFRSSRRFSCHQESCLFSIGFRVAATIG